VILKHAHVLSHILWSRPAWRVLVFVLSFLGCLCGLAAPYFQKAFIDQLLAQNPVLAEAFIAFGLMLAYHLLFQTSLWIATRESVIAQRDLADHLYQKVLHVRGALVGRAPPGEAVSLFAVDVPGAATLLDQNLATGASLIFPLLLAPFALEHTFQIPLSASFGALGILLLIHGFFAWRQSRFFIRFKQLAAERTGRVDEWVNHMRALRILGWMEQEEERIFDVRRRETQNRVSMVTNGQFMNSIAHASTYLLNALAVAYLVGVRGGSVTPGELLALLWLIGVFLMRPLRNLPWFFVMGLDGLSSSRRLDRALAVALPPPRMEPPSAALPPPKPDLALEVRGLTLESDGHRLLDEITLEVRPGEWLAIVGAVGSGKSLLLQSLVGETPARFHRFAIDAKETSGPVHPWVRSHFAYVAQEGFTISSSLRENLHFEYGAPPASDAQALRALREAQFEPTHEGVRDGLDSEIGERGVNLSGGQRQRVGLARASLAGRSIQLLDDSLSAVDVETERGLIRELLAGRWQGSTRILATHRLSVLELCDRVLFLDSGRIQDQGSLEELLERNAAFRAFFHQSRGEPHA
jgi:ABC-type multidrug transport system fused ATPase/permease subunit